MERRIAAGNWVKGAVVALVRRRNIDDTAAHLAVHNVVLNRRCYTAVNVGITEEE